MPRPIGAGGARTLGRTLLLIGFLGAGQTTACHSSPLEETRDELAAARGRWKASGPPDYDFDLQHNCFCADPVTRPVTISVRAGAFVSIVYADSGAAADTALFRNYLTVDRVFTFLQHTLDAKPASFTAAYHEQLGYPVMIHVDPLGQAADDEFSIQITSLRPVVP